MRVFEIEYEWETEEENAFSQTCLQAIERAVEREVETDIPLLVEVALVDEEEIRRLNRETRNLDKVTDVLSYPALEREVGERIRGKDYPFEQDENGRLTLGSIAICTARAREQAEEYGHSFERELYYLLVHGIMHCLGYDHETDDDRVKMREREEKVLSFAGLTR